MYLIIEENPNCGTEERVFTTSGRPRPVAQVHLDRPGRESGWWEVTGVEADGTFKNAMADVVEDSGAGTAWLVRGGDWGLRFRWPDSGTPWSLTDERQWGVPFLVLDISGSAIRFRDEALP